MGNYWLDKLDFADLSFEEVTSEVERFISHWKFVERISWWKAAMEESIIYYKTDETGICELRRASSLDMAEYGAYNVSNSSIIDLLVGLLNIHFEAKGYK